MKTSYVSEHTIQINMVADLGEVARLIDVLEGVTSNEDSSNWKAKDLLKKLKALRSEAVSQARREFERLEETS